MSVALLLAFVAGVEIARRGTVSPTWLSNTLLFAARPGVPAAGPTLVMLTGGIDLSVAAVAAGSASLLTTNIAAFGSATALGFAFGFGLRYCFRLCSVGTCISSNQRPILNGHARSLQRDAAEIAAMNINSIERFRIALVRDGYRQRELHGSFYVIEHGTMEKRAAPRQRVVLAGRILLEGGGAIDCRLRDQSSSGVRLKVATVIGIPNRFVISVPATGLQRTAEIVWRKETELAVRFV